MRRTLLVATIAALVGAGCLSAPSLAPLIIVEEQQAQGDPRLLAGETVTFRAIGSLAGARTRWDFGDGAAATGETVTHSYAGPLLATVTARAGPVEVEHDVEVWAVFKANGVAPRSLDGAAKSSHDIVLARQGGSAQGEITADSGGRLGVRLVSPDGEEVVSSGGSPPVRFSVDGPLVAGTYRLEVWMDAIGAPTGNDYAATLEVAPVAQVSR